MEKQTLGLLSLSKKCQKLKFRVKPFLKGLRGVKRARNPLVAHRSERNPLTVGSSERGEFQNSPVDCFERGEALR